MVTCSSGTQGPTTVFANPGCHAPPFVARLSPTHRLAWVSSRSLGPDARAAPGPRDSMTSFAVGGWGINLEDRDPAVRPGDNFFLSQNGHWFARTILDAVEPASAYWRDLRRMAQRRLQTILSLPPPTGRRRRRVPPGWWVRSTARSWIRPPSRRGVLRRSSPSLRPFAPPPPAPAWRTLMGSVGSAAPAPSTSASGGTPTTPTEGGRDRRRRWFAPAGSGVLHRFVAGGLQGSLPDLRHPDAGGAALARARGPRPGHRRARDPDRAGELVACADARRRRHPQSDERGRARRLAPDSTGGHGSVGPACRG